MTRYISQFRIGVLRRPAFTLAEALLATTILSVVAATALLPFAAGLQNTQEAIKFEQAVELGEALMEEVLARPFFAPSSTAKSPGPDSGESSRKLYNEIDDFHGLSEYNAISQKATLVDYAGDELSAPQFAGYHREVSVSYVTFDDQPAGDDDAFVHVQVRVYHEKNLLVTLDRLVARED